MAQKRRKCPGLSKLETVRLWQTTEKSACEVEDDLSIARGLLCRWKRQLASKGEKAFKGQGRMSALDEEIRRLKRELEIVKQERDILKKVAIFSHPNE